MNHIPLATSFSVGSVGMPCLLLCITSGCLRVSLRCHWQVAKLHLFSLIIKTRSSPFLCLYYFNYSCIGSSEPCLASFYLLFFLSTKSSRLCRHRQRARSIGDYVVGEVRRKICYFAPEFTFPGGKVRLETCALFSSSILIGCVCHYC